jgi:hypothetical protein
LTGAPGAVTEGPPRPSTPTGMNPAPARAAGAQTTEELLATILALQEQLGLSTTGAGTPHSATAPPSYVYTGPAVTHLGVGHAPTDSPTRNPSPLLGTGMSPAATHGAAAAAAAAAIRNPVAPSGAPGPVPGRSSMPRAQHQPHPDEYTGSHFCWNHSRWPACLGPLVRRTHRTHTRSGVYQDYAKVAPLVVGVSGAVFRGGFKTKAEAESYMSHAMAIPVTTSPSPRKQKWYVICVGRDPRDRGVYEN